jgi:hypothetical protein
LLGTPASTGVRLWQRVRPAWNWSFDPALPRPASAALQVVEFRWKTTTCFWQCWERYWLPDGGGWRPFPSSELRAGRTFATARAGRHLLACTALCPDPAAIQRNCRAEAIVVRFFGPGNPNRSIRFCDTRDPHCRRTWIVKKRQHDGDKNNLTFTLTSGLTRYLAEIRRFSVTHPGGGVHLSPKLARAR